MASREGGADVVDATMDEPEDVHEQEDAKQQEDEVVEVDGQEDEQEDEQKQEDSEEDDVQFVGSVEGDGGRQETPQEDTEEDVVLLEDNKASSSPERSTADTDALMAAKGYVTPATLEAELQCIICQYAMFKLLIPSVPGRVKSYQQEEEIEFTHKLDQLDAKWKIFTLSERAARYHGDHDEDEEARSSGRWEEDHEGHEEYPVIKVEDTDDGNLHVSRNIVLDTNDENEDGYVNMRVGIAIVEFPSIFELYNEHQECSVNVIKMEEDEEMADGMPFFMNEDGDDDGFVCSSYYNEISLRVCDEAVREAVFTPVAPHEISDTPVADYVSLINDEARDANRRNRRRHHDSDDEDNYDEDGNESDDSFIVDDINGEPRHEEPVGRFSDDEDEGQWEYHSDDEAADEEREQRRVRRQQRSGRRSERDVQFVDEHDGDELSGEVEHDADEQGDADEEEEEEHEDEEVQLRRRNVRVVEESGLSSDGEAEHEVHDEVEVADDETKEDEQQAREVSRPRRRNANQIIDSDDEDDGAPPQSDEEHKEDNVSDDEQQQQHDDNEDDGDDDVAEEKHEDEDDTVVRSRKVKRAQWFQDDESEEEDKPPQPDEANAHLEEADALDRRPRKRARDRQVRIVDEGESEEEKEQMERFIVAANSAHTHEDDDEDTEEDAGSAQFRRVHQFYDEEVDEQHEYDDAQQDGDDAPDYPDEDEEANYQEEDYFSDRKTHLQARDGGRRVRPGDVRDALAQGGALSRLRGAAAGGAGQAAAHGGQAHCRWVEFWGGDSSPGRLTCDVAAGLQEAEKAEGSSLVSYADRLRNFPARVERLQKKLARIQDRLLAMKESRKRGLQAAKFQTESPSAVYASPLF
ncbi:unnamed protein product [Phytophthora lilii]|uniref:Unnamed protein product n=1 Tax=Phytophthora lilii TaxID=2077276 RepID=A0A9W6WP73_9STRA|nr:unnamed protein product [Phytophthora lilii]